MGCRHGTWTWTSSCHGCQRKEGTAHIPNSAFLCKGTGGARREKTQRPSMFRPKHECGSRVSFPSQTSIKQTKKLRCTHDTSLWIGLPVLRDHLRLQGTVQTWKTAHAKDQCRRLDSLLRLLYQCPIRVAGDFDIDAIYSFRPRPRGIIAACCVLRAADVAAVVVDNVVYLVALQVKTTHDATHALTHIAFRQLFLRSVLSLPHNPVRSKVVINIINLSRRSKTRLACVPTCSRVHNI